MNLRTLFRARHARLQDKLDAFVDGALYGSDLERVEAHLPGCASCRQRVTEAEKLKLLVAALPELPAPRSFALTDAMVGAQRPVKSASGSFIGNAMRGMQGMAAAGIALFAVLVFVDASGGGSTMTSTQPADFDAASTEIQEAGDDGEDGAADLQPPGDAASGGSDGGDDAGSPDEAPADDGALTPPDATPTGGVGAASNDPPDEPSDGSDDDSVTESGEGRNQESSDERPEPATDADDLAGPEGETALYSASEESDGVDWLRAGQILAAGATAVAVGGYLATRRYAARQNR